jgi:acylphosphatase
MDAERAHLELIISGRVQGVAFRYHASDRARRLGVTGRVRNRPDGTVHLRAEGTREALEQLAHWAARGPDHARVDACEVRWSPARDRWTDFHIDG